MSHWSSPKSVLCCLGSIEINSHARIMTLCFQFMTPSTPTLLRPLSQNEKVTKCHEGSSTSSSQTSIHSNAWVPRRSFWKPREGDKETGSLLRTFAELSIPSSAPCRKSSTTRRFWEPTNIDQVLGSTSRKPGLAIEWRITRVGSV